MWPGRVKEISPYGLKQGRVATPHACVLKPCTRPPENQIVRINFDAAFSQRHLRSALRLVARNDRGKVLVSKSILENRIASPFAAKACACSQAVRLGIGMGVDEVEIEGDALTIIKKC
ncbi:hypothetical protein Gotur_009049 [Gossypium turneri]